MLKIKSSITHRTKQIEKIKLKKGEKSMHETKTKKLIAENKLLKEALKDAQRIIASSNLKIALNQKNVIRGAKDFGEDMEFLENLVDAIPGNIYWKTRRGVYLGCNTAFAKILHLKSNQDIIGKNDYDFLNKRAASKIVKIDREVMEHDAERVMEETGCDIHGKPAIYLSKKIPLHDRHGAVVGLAGVSLDITERKKYEELLRKEKEALSRAKKITAEFISKMQYEVTGRQSRVGAERSAQEIKEYLEKIITLIPLNVYWKDRSGHYLFSNSKMVETIGLQFPQDAVGKTIYDLTTEKKQADFVHSTDEAVMRENKEQKIEETVLDAEGNQLTFLTYKIPLHDVKGKVVGLLGVSLNISERKRAEIKLLQLEREKAAADERMKTVELFSGFLAHELGNAVAGVKINADVLKGLMPLLSQLIDESKEAKNCKRELTVMSETIKQVVNAASSAEKIFNITLMNMKTASIPKERMQSSSIKHALETAVAEYPYREGEAKKISVTGQDFTYIGIPIYTEHVFLNLIKNACQAIREVGKGQVAITIRPAQDKAQYHQVIFRDTGGGIAEEFAPKLFQRFASNRRKGTGLGLAFCKTYMEAIGGDITCASKFGSYTEFTLLFPVT